MYSLKPPPQVSLVPAHLDVVKAIVQKSVKDRSIEQTIRTYEEIWLSKVFNLKLYVNNKLEYSNKQSEDDVRTHILGLGLNGSYQINTTSFTRVSRHMTEGRLSPRLVSCFKRRAQAPRATSA